MRNFIFTLLLTLLLAGCAHKIIGRNCTKTVDQPEFSLCDSMGWFR